jgi:hypothetical protein
LPRFWHIQNFIVKGLLNGHLGSPLSKFLISNDHSPYRKLGFFSINTYIYALNQGSHTSFSKIIFWNKNEFSIRVQWTRDCSIYKIKHIILTWINHLKYYMHMSVEFSKCPECIRKVEISFGNTLPSFLTMK